MHRMRTALWLTSQWLILEDPDAEEGVDLSHVTMINVAAVQCRAGNSCCSVRFHEVLKTNIREVLLRVRDV